MYHELRKRGTKSPPRSADLLAWYDLHRRKLPWRALPGEQPDPYRVWLSEVMLQQTTVATVVPYFERFTAKWPDVLALAAAPLEDVLRMWAGLGYYARARHLHACARAVVEKYGARFPEAEAELRGLPGIGPYTAAAVAAIAFGQRAAPVDGNIERVIARLHAVEQPVAAAKEEFRALAQALMPDERTGDFAQALMDLGATICTPKQPSCRRCPWSGECAANRSGEAARFPIAAEKKRGRLRRGAAFVLQRADGFLLLRRREAKGLLGGMSEVPTTDWTPDFDPEKALLRAPRLGRTRPPWRRLAGKVTHVFTHFPLELIVYAAQVGPRTAAPAGMRWVPNAELAGEALPRVMCKVIAHAGYDMKPV